MTGFPQGGCVAVPRRTLIAASTTRLKEVTRPMSRAEASRSVARWRMGLKKND